MAENNIRINSEEDDGTLAFLNIEPDKSSRHFNCYEYDQLHIWSSEQPKILKLATVYPSLVSKTQEEVKLIDVTFFEALHNFKKYVKGSKVYSRFFVEADFEDGVTIPTVERIYTHLYEDGILVGLKTDMKWYNIDGSVACEKVSIDSYSSKDAAKTLKDIREVQILALQNPEGVDAVVKGKIDTLFAHYKTQVSDYILNASKAFEDAILTETNQDIIDILNVEIDGKTIKERILEEIN